MHFVGCCGSFLLIILQQPSILGFVCSPSEKVDGAVDDDSGLLINANRLWGTLSDLSRSVPEGLVAAHRQIIEAALDIVQQSETSLVGELGDGCPLGLLVAYTYLATAQETDLKHSLLHKATYLLYASADMPRLLKASSWPVTDELLKTLYWNTERAYKGLENLATSGRESIMFYRMYLDDLCTCTTRAWCLPFWFSTHFPNFDVFIVPRDDDEKAVYAFDRGSSCFVKTSTMLSQAVLDDILTYLFIFDINSFMEPEARSLKSVHTVLYPAYDLSVNQIENFSFLKVKVIPDDAIFKPPNPVFTRLLSTASEGDPARKNTLIYLAEVRPLKGQLEFLQAIGSSSVLDVDIHLMGHCVGNQRYCEQVMENVERLKERVTWIPHLDSDVLLASILAESLGLVLAPLADCNPRVVYEALWAGTPFLVNEAARIPHQLHALGQVFAGDVVPAISAFVLASRNGGWNRVDLHHFAQKFFNEDVSYTQLTDMFVKAAS